MPRPLLRDIDLARSIKRRRSTRRRFGEPQRSQSMQATIHFISGLPRAGSTLLSAILRQNPRFHAGMTGPGRLAGRGDAAQHEHGNETSIFITDAQREALLRSVFSTFYAEVPRGDVVFDTNRVWCTKLPLLAALFPAGQGDLLRARRAVDFRLDRTADPQEQIPALRHFQLRARGHRIFTRRGAGFGQRHGRLCLERAARSVLRRAHRPAIGADLRDADQPAALRGRRGLRFHRREAVSRTTSTTSNSTPPSSTGGSAPPVCIASAAKCVRRRANPFCRRS